MSNTLRNLDKRAIAASILTLSALTLSLTGCSQHIPTNQEQTGSQLPDKEPLYVTHLTHGAYKDGAIIFSGDAALEDGYNGARNILKPTAVSGKAFCKDGQVVETTNLTHGVAVPIMDQAIPSPNPCQDDKINRAESKGFDITTYRGDSELIPTPAGMIVLVAAGV